jgi:hypothetical protein
MLRPGCGFKLAADGQDTTCHPGYLGHRSIQRRPEMIGRKYGVRGTPAWLLSQRLIVELLSAAEFERLADYAMHQFSR